jgi:DNA modification methylase
MKWKKPEWYSKVETAGCGRKIRTGQKFAVGVGALFEAGVREGLSLDDMRSGNVEFDLIPNENATPPVGLDNYFIEYPCCTIINADCLDHLWRFDPKTFDLVITDPPYGMKIKAWQDHHAPVSWDDEYPTGAVSAIIEDKLCGLPRLASYFFCRWDNLWDDEKRKGDFPLRKPNSVLVWHKIGVGGGSLGDVEHSHGRDYEMALFYPRLPDHKFKKRPRSVLTYERPGNDAHPTEKPVEMLKEMMSWYDFETVFDPFMGSGSTAVAAKEMGKHFLGFELDKTYYNRAVQRLAETPRG